MRFNFVLMAAATIVAGSMAYADTLNTGSGGFNTKYRWYFSVRVGYPGQL